MGNVQAQLKERIEEWKDKKEFKKTVAEQERERKRQRARGKKGRFSIDLDPDLAEYFVGDDAFATALQRMFRSTAIGNIVTRGLCRCGPSEESG